MNLIKKINQSINQSIDQNYLMVSLHHNWCKCNWESM